MKVQIRTYLLKLKNVTTVSPPHSRVEVWGNGHTQIKYLKTTYCRYCTKTHSTNLKYTVRVLTYFLLAPLQLTLLCFGSAQLALQVQCFRLGCSLFGQNPLHAVFHLQAKRKNRWVQVLRTILTLSIFTFTDGGTVGHCLLLFYCR